MANPRTAVSASTHWKRLLTFALQAAVILAVGRSAQAQTAETLSQVRKVYIESFGSGDSATGLRAEAIKQIRKNGRLEVVTSPTEADAIVKGNVSIWATGSVSAEPRASSNSSVRAFHGFLSVEIDGRNNEPLWSYLVTPSKFRTSTIIQDLANQFVAKLSAALDQPTGKAPAASPTSPAGATYLTGAGATFPAPLYQRWFESFQELNPRVHIAYGPVGSDAGLQLLADGQADFAASDVPLSDEKISQLKASVLQFATVVGAVVPIYNVKGADRSLNFTGESLAQIYLGKIKNWSDPILQKSNRKTHLPSGDIVVVHRSDGSGTTFVWTDYLSKVSPEWKAAVGANTVIDWPVGLGAEGNEGVAALVERTPNSFGYVELVYALQHHLNYGAVQNAVGQFVQANLETVTAAAKGAGSEANLGAGSEANLDFRGPIKSGEGKNAYPISTFTWWVLPEALGGADKKPVFLDLLRWILTSGQNQCSALGFVPLPQEIAAQQLRSLARLH